MSYKTWGDIKTKIERDLDLEGEVFISENELLGYANEAIDEIEGHIHEMCEDYFLTRSPLTLVIGQENYDLPSDIFAMKVRGVIYRNGNETFKIERVKDWRKFEEYEFNKTGLQYNQLYKFMIINASAGTPQLLLTPAPQEAGQYIQVWYIRNANVLTDDSSICDIPESVNYVIKYVKMKVYEKELHPNLPKAMADVADERTSTYSKLASMVVDNSNEIEADFSHYQEMT